VTFEALECRAEILKHGSKAAFQGSPTAHYHIIMVWAHGYGIQPFHQFAKPAANAVALWGCANFFAHSEADPDWSGIVARPALHHKGRASHAGSLGGCNEIGALLQPVHNFNRRLKT
jgi:hypothetical protein